MIAYSAESRTILLLCAHFGSVPDDGANPLSRREWNELSIRLQGSALKQTGALMESKSSDLRTVLQLSAAMIQRLQCLLGRARSLSEELERLQALGIWAVTRADDDYPVRFRERLGMLAPTVLFGSGPRENLARPGLAIVGSRDVDTEGGIAAAFAGQLCARVGWNVYSGGARGVDQIAMNACLQADGQVVGVLADSLEKAIRAPRTREAIDEGRLTLLTENAADAPFSVSSALGRNKLIYGLADYGLVIASEEKRGGTWAGAIEALKNEWIPVFVRAGEEVPDGNRKLIERGGTAFPFPFPGAMEEAPGWMERRATEMKKRTLFE